MTSTISPCAPWATMSDLPEDCSDAAIKPAVLDQGLLVASTVLFNLTNRRWRGACTDSYRPLGNGCWACPGDDADHREIRLPATGVRAITSVVIDGETIDPSTYVVRDGRYLRRLRAADGSGETSWPCWQDLARDDADPVNTFVIDYTWGIDPPPEMVIAAARLGFEFALAWTPDCANRCRLPRNVTSITRNGVTTSFPDPASLFDDGKTHVPDVDLLVAAVNRGEAKQRPLVAVAGRRVGTRSTT